MLKCFPVKSLKLIPHQIVSMGTGVIMQNDDSVRHHSSMFWVYGTSQYPQPQRNESHLSALLFLPPFTMLDEHTLHYAHLQSNEEITIWICVFSLCMSPTLQVEVSILKDSIARFCEECVLWRVFGFHFDCPSYYELKKNSDCFSDFHIDRSNRNHVHLIKTKYR